MLVSQILRKFQVSYVRKDILRGGNQKDNIRKKIYMENADETAQEMSFKLGVKEKRSTKKAVRLELSLRGVNEEGCSDNEVRVINRSNAKGDGKSCKILVTVAIRQL